MNNKAVNPETKSAHDPRPEISASPRDAYSQIERLERLEGQHTAVERMVCQDQRVVRSAPANQNQHANETSFGLGAGEWRNQGPGAFILGCGIEYRIRTTAI